MSNPPTTATTTSPTAARSRTRTGAAVAAATSHLADRPPVHRGVGLAVPRSQARPRGQVRGGREPVHVPDPMTARRRTPRPAPGRPRAGQAAPDTPVPGP